MLQLKEVHRLKRTFDKMKGHGVQSIFTPMNVEKKKIAMATSFYLPRLGSVRLWLCPAGFCCR